MASDSQHIFRQVYNASTGINLESDTERVICIFFRRGLAAAAFNFNNILISIHYAAYSREKPVWEIDFFEQLFHQEPLLLKKSLIKKFFFLSGSNLVVPEALENEQDVQFWFNSVHFAEPVDVLERFWLAEDNSAYYYAYPKYLKELARINSYNAQLAPLPVFHFRSNNVTGVKLYCTLTNEQACITLYNQGLLLWHKIFDYASAEDIVYMVKLVCKEHKINSDKVTILCNALSADEYKTINELSQYFAGVTAGNGDEFTNFWSPVTTLVKQLDACEL